MEPTFNPWLKIWVEPRATISRLVQESPERGFWFLAVIYGFSSLLNWFQSMMVGHRLGIIPIFAIALIASPLWGYLSFSVWSFIVHFTGKWFKGQGSFKDVRTAYAWSCVPLVVNVILWFVLTFLFGRALFANLSPEAQVFTHGQIMVLFGAMLLRIGTAIWSLVIYLNALAEVQKYSVLRAIGNALLSALIVGFIFYSLIWLIHQIIMA
jgi:hypothetical protein